MTAERTPEGNRFSDQFSTLPEDELLAKLKEQSFFHDMDLGISRTGTWVYPDTMPPNYHLFPALQLLLELDLKQTRCLDIGSFDGMTAFVLEKLGAERIDATCQYDLDRFRITRAIGHFNNVAYYPKTDIKDIAATFTRNNYDLICMTAMLHHLLSPLEGLMIARTLLRQNGLLIVDAAVLPGNDPVMTLNTELVDAVVGAPTIWLPSASALSGMLRLAGFEILVTYRLQGGALARETNFDRLTFLAKAVRPSQITNRTEKLTEVHGVAGWNPVIDFPEIEKQDEKNEHASPISFNGVKGERCLNIWSDYPKAPLQPSWADPDPVRHTQFKVGTNNHFMQLMHENKDDLWNAKDTTLLATRYPGEIFPEGMTWSLKQYANLFCLSHIKLHGLKNIAEIGAGFNLYFENHLPEWCTYTAIDDAGFYDKVSLEIAASLRTRGRTVDALLGGFSDELKDASFDACISCSVLEHVPEAEIDNFNKDMFRILVPGGWAIHSIDLAAPALDKTARLWLKSLQSQGYLLNPDAINLSLDWENRTGDEPFIEPISIIDRFFGAYRAEPWTDKNWYKGSKRMHTVLFAARKPLD